MSQKGADDHLQTVETTRRLLLQAIGIASVYRPSIAWADASLTPLAVTQVAAGIFVHTGQHGIVSANNGGDIANSTVIIGKDAVAVIDTGASALLGARLRATVATLTPLPVRYVINTHMHPDHVLGNVAFAADRPEFVAHHKMARGLSARAATFLMRLSEQLGDKAFEGTKIVYPTKPVVDRMTIDLGGRTLELVARPTAHTDNDLTVRDSVTDTVCLGDLLFSGHVPTLDGSIVGWLKLIEALKQEPATRVVPGHGPATMPWPDAIAPVERYLSAIARDVRQAIKDGTTLSDATKTAAQMEKAAWELFEEHHVRNVTAAFAELEWE